MHSQVVLHRRCNERSWQGASCLLRGGNIGYWHRRSCRCACRHLAAPCCPGSFPRWCRRCCRCLLLGQVLPPVPLHALTLPLLLKLVRGAVAQLPHPVPCGRRVARNHIRWLCWDARSSGAGGPECSIPAACNARTWRVVQPAVGPHQAHVITKQQRRGVPAILQPHCRGHGATEQGALRRPVQRRALHASAKQL